MRKELGDREKEALLAASASVRYEHFVKQVADWEEVWSLRNDDGWVIVGDNEGRELAPVWPHAAYAQACATGDWFDCLPTAISLENWMRAWLPDLQRDGRLVAVFATPNDQAAVVSPEQLRAHLEEELENYE